MNVAQARRTAWRWFAAFIAAFIVRITLRFVGIDEFDLPLEVVEAVALILGWRYKGWIDGYLAGQRADERKVRG